MDHPSDRWTSREGYRFCHRALLHPQPRFAPTLFVSGAFQTMDSWARIARGFTPHTTVVLVDPPGIGTGDVLPPHVGLDFLAGALAQVLDERGIERANVVAASYGTASAYRFAQLHPERVGRIVLAGTMRAIPDVWRLPVAASIGDALRGDREALAASAVDALGSGGVATDVDRPAAAARVLRSGILRMSERELLQYAANTQRLLDHRPLDLERPIVGPEALAFTGEHDGFTPPEACREVARAFGRAWFTTVRRADHLFHLQRAETVLELLVGFVDHGLRAGAPAGCTPLEAVGRDVGPTIRRTG